jgi:archaellum biogenesis ATPase FlaH
MHSLEEIILNNLVTNEEFCRTALPHLKAEYFEGATKETFKLIDAYITKYNNRPNATSLAVECQTADIVNSPHISEIAKHLTGFATPLETDREWLLENTEKWCKDRAVFNAVMESIAIIDGKRSNKTEGMIPELLSTALSVCFDTNVGHDYIDNASARYDFYHKKEDKIAFDVEMLNTITNGGVGRKTLNLLMAGTGVGKSLVMCHFASSYLSQGLNVLYITMEMAEERIAERIDANLLDTRIDQLKNLSESSFSSKIGDLAKKTRGKLLIKEYPTASAHAGHFRALINELALKKNFKADVIFIDYLNICASSRIKGLSGGVNTYSLVKAIAEELRGLAVENNVPIWTATQVNRQGASSSDMELTDTSESFGLPATADLFLALLSTEQLESMGQLMIKQLKNRYNDISKNKRFTVGLDRAKMRLYDIADPTANLINAASPSSNPVVSSPFSNKSRKVNDFKDFTVE